MKQRSTQETVRRLVDLTPRQLERLRRMLAATKGLRAHQVRELLHIVGNLRGDPR